MDRLAILFRIALTFALSLIYGVDRQRSHKPISFGTFSFVAVGSCALALTAMNLMPENPLALLGAIVTGIGFLGAGALIKTTDKIFHFTTASSIWVFAIFGLAIGVGEYFVGTLLYAVVWIVIFYDSHLEKEGIGTYQRKLVINTNKIISERELRDILLVKSKKSKLIDIYLDKKEHKISFTYLIEGTKEHINSIPKTLYDKDWFESCKIE
ncbi:MAG: MgtC/SapB family protein [archaeon]